MKKTALFTTFLAAFALVSCELNKDSGSSTSIGGDTNVPMNTVGNVFSGNMYFGNSSVQPTGVISQSSDGIITVDVTAAIPADFPLASLIPDSYKDDSGNLSTQLQFKNTSDGILDYMNKDGSPFVLVKYDCSVGDKYVLEKEDGTKITRTVTKKSSTDDYSYGFYLIKTVTVEQDSRIPGIEKIIYNANHKFGLVGIQIVMEDGTTYDMSLYSTNDLK
jgi:hypothetical protein